MCLHWSNAPRSGFSRSLQAAAAFLTYEKAGGRAVFGLSLEGFFMEKCGGGYAGVAISQHDEKCKQLVRLFGLLITLKRIMQEER